jgi:hypothetical protein
MLTRRALKASLVDDNLSSTRQHAREEEKEEEHDDEEKGDSKPRAKRYPPRISRRHVNYGDIDYTEQNVTDNDEEGNDDSVKRRAKKKPRSKISSEQNDEEGEPPAQQWTLVGIYSTQQILKRYAVKCMGEKCRLVACSIWSSTLHPGERRFSCLGKLLCIISCFILLLNTIRDDISSIPSNPPHSHTHSSSPLDCQEDDFDGWGDKLPVKGHLDDEWRNAVRNKCTDDDDPVMPNVPRVPGGEPTTACPVPLTGDIIRKGINDLPSDMEFVREQRIDGGYTGVYYDQSKEKWVARKTFDKGKGKISIGSYDTEDEAALVIVKAVYWYTNIYIPSIQSTVPMKLDGVDSGGSPSPLTTDIVREGLYNGDNSVLEIKTLMDLAIAGKITYDDTDYQRIREEDIRDTDYIVGKGSKKKAGNDAFCTTLDTFLLGYDECPRKKDIDKFTSGLLMNKDKSIRVRFLERYREDGVDYWGNIREERIYSIVRDMINKKIAKKSKNTKGKSTKGKKTHVEEWNLDSDAMDVDSDADSDADYP